MKELLDNLNGDQLEAVLYNEGPLLLLAGAGTGKTRVLTSKIAYLLKNKITDISRIMAVTFTNKAADEMKRRVAAMLDTDIAAMWIGTFHSTSARILRQHGNYINLDRDFTIVDSLEQATIIKQIMREMGVDPRDNNPKYYAEMIGKIKNDMKGVDYSIYKLSELYELYTSRLKQMNVCDFNDLILNVLKLFSSCNEIRELYSRMFSYILVDEYQDTNALQHRWLKLISDLGDGESVKITCVGDDDQSIYGWRGAEIDNLLKFTKSYRTAKILKLEQNYRSTQNILNVASTLISNNKHRHRKTLYASEGGENEKVQLIICNDTKQEAVSIVSEIEKLKKTNYIGDYRDIGILIRAGYQTRVFEDVFLKFGIPYRIVGGLKFYERKEVRDCIAYLRFINNPADSIAFERIVNLPRRGIGPTTLTKIRDFAIDGNIDYLAAIVGICANGVIGGMTREQILNFHEKISRWRREMTMVTPRNLMLMILSEIRIVDSAAGDSYGEGETRLENVKELVSTLEDFSNLGDFFEYVSLMGNDEDSNVSGAVNIMTIHSAKGLEFDVIFLPNWQEGVFPSPKSIEEKNGLEEERRLAYVAITRTKRKLYISYSKLRYEYGDVTAMSVSRFIEELPQESVAIVNYEPDSEYYSDYYSQKQNYGGWNRRRNNGDKHQEIRSHEFFRRQRIDDSYGDSRVMTNSYGWTAYPAGDAVKNRFVPKKCVHKKFGEGYIKSEDNNKLTIVFKNCGEKIILKDFVDIISSTATN
ncbi:MAG: UvrD-helicase domain-containing protein [Rickettsiales bacterium]|jgi:DNA helicase-2/ATP-dependent DNA helicase PcrA|nr:UvrD-helicase domain-containing protein [Rickettsiales bacterium]